MKKLLTPAIVLSAFLISGAYTSAPKVTIGNGQCYPNSYCITVFEGPTNNGDTLNYNGTLAFTYQNKQYSRPVNGQLTPFTPFKISISPEGDPISAFSDLDFNLTPINGLPATCRISIDKSLTAGSGVLEVNYDKASNTYKCTSLVQ